MKYTMTKIIATLGTSTGSKEKIRELFKAGVTMFRLNSSHSEIEILNKYLNFIREIEKEENTLIPILLDLQGAKIRIGILPHPIEIKKAETVKFSARANFSDDIIPVDYEGIADDVSMGEMIMVDDGKIRFEVSDVKNGIVFAKALTDGLLKQRKGINIPAFQKSIDILQERDKKFIKFAVLNDIDYLGLSFVRNAADVLELRRFLDNFENSGIKIISKIEKPQAVENIYEIIDVSDGIMVARGDLGIEIPMEEVPIVQKTVIKKANSNLKAVIVATQMLESMIENPIPTRAETSDVANAILDGTDAVMLSGETAIGAYPIEAVEMMKKIADTVENSSFMKKNKFPCKMTDKMSNNENFSQSVATGLSIAYMATKSNIKAVVVLTTSCYISAMLSKCKLSIPIFVCCDSVSVCRRVKLYRGVFPIPFN